MKAYKKSLIKPWFDKQYRGHKTGRPTRWTIAQVKRLSREIDERSLDIEVAQKVFDRTVELIEVTEYLDYGSDVNYPELGFKIHHRDYVPGEPSETWTEEIELPHYLTDIKDAWKIIDKFGGFYTGESSPIKHYWQFPTEDRHGEPSWIGAEGNTVEEAICLAALEAVNANR